MPTHDELIAALERAGANLECLSCGANEWIGMGEGGEADLLYILAAVRGGKPQVASPAYPMFGLYCGRCGYGRFHHPDGLRVPGTAPPGAS
jgi:hypothetical protein